MPPRDSDVPDRRESDDGFDSDPEFMPFDEPLDGIDDVDDLDDSPTAEFGEPIGEFGEDELAGLHYDVSGMPLGPRRVLPLEDEPSAFVARYLFPTEKFRGEWRKHWTYLFDQFAVGAVATFVFGWLWGYFAKHHYTAVSTAVIIAWVVVMFWVSWRVADWYFDRFILTNKRIMSVSGMVTRTVGMMPLLRVTDMKYEQSSMGRLFNYGNFVLESAGQDQALREVKHLPNPNELYLRIVEEMYEPEAVEAKLTARMSEDDGS
jgi:membrane protein YdbS with pleckstrin-like domain